MMTYLLTQTDGDTAPSVAPSITGGTRAARLDEWSRHRWAIRALAAAALLGCMARPAHPQAGAVGRLEGTVRDSAHARPLIGVRVVAIGDGARADARGSATTDTVGRFRIDSLPPGRYLVGFESPLLDSLEIVLPARETTVAPGSTATVNLAMPPAAKLRAALCPGVALGDGSGVVYGHAVSAETESPLAGVTIALHWREVSVWDAAGSKTLQTKATDRSASATTDGRGWYRACGVPTGTWVSMQIQQEGRVGPVLRTLVDDTLGIAIRHLSFSASAARDTADITDGATTAPLTGTATLTGIVRGPSGEPLLSAELHVPGTGSTGVTDAQGSYTMSGLPAGTHALEVRRIGYGATDSWVELRNGATTRSDVRLPRIVSLDSVRIVATRTRYREFSEHRKMAVFGRFLGPEDIQRRRVSRTSDIIRSASGPPMVTVT